jgi:hypothetical protein
MAKLSAGHIRVQPSSTMACRPNFWAYCHNLMKVRRVICIQSQKSRPLVFLHLWLFCTSPWPEHVVYAYNHAKLGRGHEKVLRYRLFAGIGIERCRLRGQRQVPGWGKGKSTSASRRNEGLVSAERRAGPVPLVPPLDAAPWDTRHARSNSATPRICRARDDSFRRPL